MSRNYPLPGYPLILQPKDGFPDAPGSPPTPAQVNFLADAGSQFKIASADPLTDTTVDLDPQGSTVSRPRPWCRAGYPIAAPPRAVLIAGFEVVESSDVQIAAPLRAALQADLEKAGILCEFISLGDMTPSDGLTNDTESWTYPGYFDDTGVGGSGDSYTFNSLPAIMPLGGQGFFYGGAEFNGSGTHTNQALTLNPDGWVGREVLLILITSTVTPFGLMDASYGVKITVEDAGQEFHVDPYTHTFASVGQWESYFRTLSASGLYKRYDGRMVIIQGPTPTADHASVLAQDSVNPGQLEADCNSALASNQAQILLVLQRIASSLGGPSAVVPVADYLGDMTPVASVIEGWIRAFYEL